MTASFARRSEARKLALRVCLVSEKVARSVVFEHLARGVYVGAEDRYERLAIDWDILEAFARAGAFNGL